ncbi:hypothetical protein BX600DRAFT_431700 [Xylariales sp. PMI_506]|nr:hypothetical protein BX600DRAFT_431700 [Xylariales sp. PMI_506]
MATFNTARIPDTYNPSDKSYVCRFTQPLPKVKNLAENVSASWLWPIYHQHNTESCVANATAAAVRFVAHRTKEERNISVPDAALDPSRLFIYFNARTVPNLESSGDLLPLNSVLQDGGSQNRDSLKGVALLGVCSDAKWKMDIDNPENPEDGNPDDNRTVRNVNQVPPEDAFNEAPAVKLFEYCRLDPDHPDEIEKQLTLDERVAVGKVTLSKLRQCLAEGYPVVFGFWWYSDDPKWGLDKNNTHRVMPDLEPNERHAGPPKNANGSVMYGGHTVLAIGYDDNEKLVLCQNSYGPNWGSANSGRFWLPYHWVEDWEATDDFWMIRTMQEKDDPVAHRVTPEDATQARAKWRNQAAGGNP